jgi:hypothetical protein
MITTILLKRSKGRLFHQTYIALLLGGLWDLTTLETNKVKTHFVLDNIPSPLAINEDVVETEAAEAENNGDIVDNNAAEAATTAAEAENNGDNVDYGAAEAATTAAEAENNGDNVAETELLKVIDL